MDGESFKSRRLSTSALNTLIAFGLVVVTLFIGALLIPSAGFLGLPLFIIGAIVAARILKDAAKVSPNARAAVKFFKVMAGIGIAIVAAIIGLITFLIVMLSQADVGS